MKRRLAKIRATQPSLGVVVVVLTATLAGLWALFVARLELPQTHNPHMPAEAMPYLPGWSTWAGAFDVRPHKADGTQHALTTIAQAAKRAGLNFVVLTQPDRQLTQPKRQQGVLLLGYAHVYNPAFGSVMALGAKDAPAAADVANMRMLDNLRALPSQPVVLHPDDPKAGWEGPWAGVGGLEIAHGTSAARRLAGPAYLGLLGVAAAWRLNPDTALAQLAIPQPRAQRRLDELTEPFDNALQTLAPGFCAGDLPEPIPLMDSIRLWHTVIYLPDNPPEQLHFPQKPHSAQAVLSALQQGRFFCRSMAVRGRPALHLYATPQDNGKKLILPGQSTPGRQQLVLRAQTSKIDHAVLYLLKDGDVIMQTFADTLSITDPAPGLYRALVQARVPRLFGSSVYRTVLLSNRIRITAETTELQPADSDKQPNIWNLPSTTRQVRPGDTLP